MYFKATHNRCIRKTFKAVIDKTVESIPCSGPYSDFKGHNSLRSTLFIKWHFTVLVRKSDIQSTPDRLENKHLKKHSCQGASRYIKGFA